MASFRFVRKAINLEEYKPKVLDMEPGSKGILVKCYKSLYRFDTQVSFQLRESDDLKLSAEERPLLPPPQEFGKPTLVLDMDETLLHTMSCTGDAGLTQYNEFWVGKRPGVEEFLNEMIKSYELVLWTAAEQCYADAVIDQVLDPQKVFFAHRLYSQHCRLRGKDLNALGRDMKHVVLVDDDSLKKIPNSVKGNVIKIAPYYAFDGIEDNHLEIVSRTLRNLIGKDDFVKELQIL